MMTPERRAEIERDANAYDHVTIAHKIITELLAEIDHLQKLIDIYRPKPKVPYKRPEYPFKYKRRRAPISTGELRDAGWFVIDKETGAECGHVWSTWHPFSGDTWHNSLKADAKGYTRDSNAQAVWDTWKAGQGD